MARQCLSSSARSRSHFSWIDAKPFANAVVGRGASRSQRREAGANGGQVDGHRGVATCDMRGVTPGMTGKVTAFARKIFSHLSSSSSSTRRRRAQTRNFLLCLEKVNSAQGPGMTELIRRKRRLVFETPLRTRGRPVIVDVQASGLHLREKGRRSQLEISWGQVYNRAAERQEKRTRKR